MLFDEEIMLRAIDLAKLAAKEDEIPVGAVVVDSFGRIIGEGYNQRQTKNSPTAHAEIIALEKAAKALKSWRLSECTLYVTLEPCPMCAGAIINSRVKRVVYGAFDEKGGACSSVINLFEQGFNHKPLIRGGILEKQCSVLLSEYFKDLRSKKC
ncbi:MAG: nucleoside deaminase [Clostridiales bacterium]|nr:nucleoside deaminase [Clostridiales bacterium]